MSIELKGKHNVIWMHEPHWSAIEKAAQAFGWTPEYENPPRTRSWATTWLLTEESTWALARAIHRAVDAKQAEIDAKQAEIANLRAVANLAFWGAVYAEVTFEEYEE
jgi:hypothetical protein